MSIRIPDPVFHWADRLAARLGISRGELRCRALRGLLEKQDGATIAAQLDAVYGGPKVDAGLDPALATMQWHSIRSKRLSVAKS